MLLEVMLMERKWTRHFVSNLAGAYQICKKHNLTALMAEVLDRTDVDKRSPIYQRWQMEKNQAVYKNVLMDVEREEIITFFEEKNIWYLFFIMSVILFVTSKQNVRAY